MVNDAIRCFETLNKTTQPLKKARLPRKTKKKYKKLGIYEEWKKENKNGRNY
ncbi:hypothetical protein [uncultured Thomasclavelia sp.]|uniref:hypothetical protein n=1 Tax=uncultured Thomasclavelia sp. TaxID=3025759 RepID=UPI00261CD7B0|nr:hypothetical protein [uncultured Thomasclavelia sp.]